LRRAAVQCSGPAKEIAVITLFSVVFSILAVYVFLWALFSTGFD
jgi:nitrogen fixation-related uncharacterized protein